MTDQSPLSHNPGGGEYVYAVAVRVTFRAPAMDDAYRHAQAVAAMIEREYGEPNLMRAEARVSMLDLKHRPDLDGSLRT